MLLRTFLSTFVLIFASSCGINKLVSGAMDESGESAEELKEAQAENSGLYLSLPETGKTWVYNHAVYANFTIYKGGISRPHIARICGKDIDLDKRLSKKPFEVIRMHFGDNPKHVSLAKGAYSVVMEVFPDPQKRSHVGSAKAIIKGGENTKVKIKLESPNDFCKKNNDGTLEIDYEISKVESKSE